MFSLFVGRKFSKEISTYLGVDNSLFSSALLETGTTWAHLKVLKNAGLSVELAAEELMPQFVQGLAIIDQKYGPQELIVKAESAIEDWSRKRERGN